MIEMDLRRELEAVAERYRRRRLWGSLAICWLAFALVGTALIGWSRAGGGPITGTAPALGVLAILAAGASALLALRSARDSAWLARRIESRFPELDARLLTAIGETRHSRGQLGFLQHTVVGETLAHARRNAWETIVSDRSLTFAKLAQTATLCGFIVVLGNLLFDSRSPGNRSNLLPGSPLNTALPLSITIEPEDWSMERGTSLLVLARFDERLPADVRLVYRKAANEVGSMVMSKSLDDPVFAGRVLSVNDDMTYAVHYDGQQTRWYKVTVFDYPDLLRADARLTFPEYTGMAETVVEDTRRITTVEGTELTLIMRLNKPVAEARLVPNAAGSQTTTDKDAAKIAGKQATNPEALSLTPDPVDPHAYTTSLVLKESRRYRLQLVDNDGRANKLPPEFVINVTPNRPPDVKVAAPARDVQVSPLEELALQARVYDDFGLRRFGVSYSMAGQPPQDIVLGETAPGKERREVAHTIAFEALQAEPDQLLSYYFWAEDSDADGAVRRTSGDMYFAEVRPFEEIFRQGQQPTGDEQQQMQQGQQGGQNARQAEELANLQKQIIGATWKLIRRETSANPTEKFVPDVQLVGESQASAKQQAMALGERLEDPRSKAYLDTVLKQMDRALAELVRAKDEPVIDALMPALAAEQAAYQGLLKLRAREHEVVRANRQQPQQAGGGGGGNRSQQQLDQLELDNSQNRYETQRSAASLRTPEQEAQERETRQVLNRLRELAQRQEDLNKQIKELQTALEEAKEQEQQEIRRQLERLRDRQQEILRDTDELRDRMQQEQNQERMVESREQLDQTRENIRRASEALEEGMVTEAAAAGARAGEELKNLRDQFRQANAGQFTEAANQLRDEARELDETQQKLSERLANLDQSTQKGLRDTGDRKEIVAGLGQQKENLERLLENMKRTIEEAESTEPLLSKELYDTAREARRQQPDQDLEISRQLLERAFVDQARGVEQQAGQKISNLRHGVEKAADSVLGDDTEGLRRARRELDALAEQLNREINRAQGANSEGDQQASAQGQQSGQQQQSAGQSQDGQTQPRQTQNGQQQEGQQQEGQQGGQQPGDRQQSGQQQGGQQGGQQQNSQQQNGQQQEGRQGGQQGGQQPGNQQQPGQQQDGQQGGQQPNGQQGGQQPGGQQQGSQQQDAQQQGGQQGGQQSGQRQGGQQGSQQGGQQPQGLRGGARTAQGGSRGGGNPEADLARILDGQTGPGGTEGPITGEGFRDWADRLRDVEEMVGDPRLRAEAARVRDRATAMRAEFKRHSKEPNWDLVQEFIGQPLVELRQAVSEELLRREGGDALVPIDREPVPHEYAEQVRRYYERLGSGR